MVKEGMQLVIDNSSMKSSELETFLKTSKSFIAILPEYVFIEAYKSDNIDGIIETFKIVGKYPTQVKILKNTGPICVVKGRKKGLRRRLIDEASTSDFGRTFSVLTTANKNPFVGRQIKEYAIRAQKHIDDMLPGVSTLKEGIEAVAKVIPENDWYKLRTNKEVKAETYQTIADLVTDLAFSLFKSHPMGPKLPTPEQLPYTFLFRFSLCAVIYTVEKILIGGISAKKVEKVRNDTIDINYAAVATFFDGLLSNDDLQNSIYPIARGILKNRFGKDL